jgi:hypothetical protein
MAGPVPERVHGAPPHSPLKQPIRCDELPDGERVEQPPTGAQAEYPDRLYLLERTSCSALGRSGADPATQHRHRSSAQGA